MKNNTSKGLFFGAALLGLAATACGATVDNNVDDGDVSEEGPTSEDISTNVAADGPMSCGCFNHNNSCANGVVLWQNKNYGGCKWDFGRCEASGGTDADLTNNIIGEKLLNPPLCAQGQICCEEQDWNDRASSINFYGNWSAQWTDFYEHANFGGAHLSASGDIPDLSTIGWNDRISSLKYKKAN